MRGDVRLRPMTTMRMTTAFFVCLGLFSGYFPHMKSHVQGEVPSVVRVETKIDFPSHAGEAVETQTVQAGTTFDEAIVSWNVGQPDGATIQIEARPSRDGEEGKWYTVARWSSDPTRSPRESVKGQSDGDASVLTDTLRLSKPASALELRITLESEKGSKAHLKLLTVAFSQGEAASKNLDPIASPSYGKVLDVPQKSQGDYPRGDVVCSPTSMSMVLNYWGNKRSRDDWKRDVPEVDAGVFDSVYGGSGNWPFNTAYAGQLDGMTAYVCRLASLLDLERLISMGIPIICSAPHSLLQGKEMGKGEEGHLVVVVGFTKDGDLVVNDPAKRDEKQKIYSRANFDQAWRRSKRTVYMVFPDDLSSSIWLP